MSTRVLLVDDQALLRLGFRLVLEAQPDIEVVGEAASPAELVTLCGATRPDAVLMELDTDSWDAPRLVAALRKRQRTLRCVGLHAGMQPDLARRAYQAGVRATVDYVSGTDGIIAALRGRASAAPVTALAPARTTTRDTLTPREVEILRLIAAGLITREIAEELDVTVKTIENHKQRIFRKLDVQNQAHAVSIAIRRGLLAPARTASRA